MSENNEGEVTSTVPDTSGEEDFGSDLGSNPDDGSAGAPWLPDDSRVNVPTDGYCLYHCAVAAENMGLFCATERDLEMYGSGEAIGKVD
eukprot:8743628-Karenia_brevis.AAC.1